MWGRGAGPGAAMLSQGGSLMLIREFTKEQDSRPLSIQLLKSPVRWLISLGLPKTTMSKPKEVSPNICCSGMKNTKTQRSKWTERVVPLVRNEVALKFPFQAGVCLMS